MYDWPELADDWNLFWRLIAEQLAIRNISAPDKLTRADDLFSLWRDPALIVGQTCGWPYANLLSDDVAAFGRFDHRLPHAPAGNYYSLYICKCGEQRTAGEILDSDSTIAVNSLDSQSGFRVLREIDSSFFSQSFSERLCESGSHRQSIRLVANGEADFAAIDAVSFEIARRFEPSAIAKLEILGHSSPKPSLPLVTAVSNVEVADKIFAALQASVEQLPDAVKQSLSIFDLLPASADSYQVFRES